MSLPRLALLLALAATACGGNQSAATVDNRNTAASADDPVATLEALAKAVDADDGAAFAALVDPIHGLTLWHTPGAGYAVLDVVKPGDTAAPSTHVGDGTAPHGAAHYWPGVTFGLGSALARLDRDPANPDDPIYGTCDDDGAPRAYRSYLATGRDDGDLRSMDLGGDGNVAPESVVRDLVQLRGWGFSAYLVRRDGGWRVLHLLVSEPCSA
jgi:hypothetical protein